MARNYSNLPEEELQEKILMVVDYIIETKCSTRKAAKYATENGFPISNVSVHNIIHKKLPTIDMEKYQKVVEILNTNTSKSIEDAKIKVRIYSATEYILQDFTILEIAKILDSTPDVIYDDLTSRLPRLDSSLAKEVRKKFQEHKLENLGQYKTGVPNEVIDNQMNKISREGGSR